MRNANSQRANSMIPVSALHQPPSPHVSHAEIGAQDEGSKTVIARSPCDEAIQPSWTGAPGFWIASHIVRRVAPPAGSQ
jgi:hypothetical protein